MVLLTIAQAATRLGTSERFVRCLTDEHRITYHKIGKHVRVDETEVDTFIASGRREAISVQASPEPARHIQSNIRIDLPPSGTAGTTREPFFRYCGTGH
ncbi:MAG: helix-turn-helix domain-containing protein [Mycobacteriales bacterium]